MGEMMPQASDEQRADWGIDSHPPQAYLRAAGYRLTGGWEWIKPEPDHEPTNNEISAINFLIDEWDYGGLIR